MDILNQLGKRIIFFEGGMGSILQQNGLAPGELLHKLPILPSWV